MVAKCSAITLNDDRDNENLLSSGRTEESEDEKYATEKSFAAKRWNKLRAGATVSIPTKYGTAKTDMLLKHVGEIAGHIASISQVFKSAQVRSITRDFVT